MPGQIPEKDWVIPGVDLTRVLTRLVRSINPLLEQHCQRVSKGAAALAQALSWPGEAVRLVALGGLFHDYGFLALPGQGIPVVEGPPEADEQEAEKHPLLGAKLLENIDSLKGVRRIIRHHHERYDGSGYPEGLKGEAIPVGARLVAIVDFYERITTRRGAVGGMDPEEARLVLREDAGIIYDPRMVPPFLDKVVPTGILDPLKLGF